MKILTLDNQYDILVSREELEILANCTRQALDMLSKEAFEMRVIEDIDVARGYLRQMKEAVLGA